jgi:DNA-binding NarL/FixJ family response regulator
MIRILIADDHPLILKGLKILIDEESDMKIVDIATDGSEALKKLRTNKYDIAVMDISMPKKTGVEILEELKYEKIKTPILILSVYPEEQYAMRLIKTGASGYLTKDTAPEELVTAIRKIVSGGKYISKNLTSKMIEEITEPTHKKPHELLSNREFRVMCLIATGKSLKEIGDELNINIKTVSTYRTRLLEKMKMETNAQLTRYAMENKLI